MSQDTVVAGAAARTRSEGRSRPKQGCGHGCVMGVRGCCEDMPRRFVPHPGERVPGWQSHALFWLGDHATWEDVDGRNVAGSESVWFDVENGAGGVERRGPLSSNDVRNCMLALFDFYLDERVGDSYHGFDAHEKRQRDAFLKAAFPMAFAATREEDATFPLYDEGDRYEVHHLPEYFHIHDLNDVQKRAAAAAAAAVLDGNFGLPDRMLAYDLLQILPPRISIRHHMSIAKALQPDARGALNCIDMAAAAHTLACLGPEAVCEHYDEITRLADEAGACESAAWLAVAVLLPEHMLGLELRGHRPVDDFMRRHIEDLWLGIRLRGLRPTPFEPPAAEYDANANAGYGYREDERFENWVFDAIPAALAAERERAGGDPRYFAAVASGRVVKDAPSRLRGFEPSPRWSRETHASFPSGARARAVELVRIGLLLGREAQWPHVLGELFVTCIVPHAVERRALPGGRHIFREAERSPEQQYPIAFGCIEDAEEIMWRVEEARQARGASEAAYKTSPAFWCCFAPVALPTKSRVRPHVKAGKHGLPEILPPKRSPPASPDDAPRVKGSQKKKGRSSVAAAGGGEDAASHAGGPGAVGASGGSAPTASCTCDVCGKKLKSPEGVAAHKKAKHQQPQHVVQAAPPAAATPPPAATPPLAAAAGTRVEGQPSALAALAGAYGDSDDNDDEAHA